MKVSVEQLEKDTNPQKESAGNTPLVEEVGVTPQETAAQLKDITRDDTLDKEEELKKRKEAISEHSVEPTDFAFERAIGRNDSLYSNFAELIALTKRKVCRIVIKEAGGISYGTGFMVSRRLLLTNWHVFKNKQMADNAEAHFFYEYDVQGHRLTPVVFRFDTTAFFSNKLLDYCFVAVQPVDVTGRVSLERIGYLYLDQTTGKVGEEGVEKLNIIHHPQGDYKQISIRENTFSKRNRLTIHYETDTSPGSSGSPVLNDQWQVIGLHHKSVAKMTEDGKNYLDKEGQIIPIIDGKVDASRLHWVKNEGIRISVIVKHLLKNNLNNEFVAGLALRPSPENLYFTTDDDHASREMKNTDGAADDSRTAMRAASTEPSSGLININVPVHALSSDRSIEISVSSKQINPDKKLEPAPIVIEETTLPSTQEPNQLLLEAAKITREQSIDFSQCDGYDPTFLGVKIPLPKPRSTIKDQIAFLVGTKNKMELKYFKYSVIFNKKTRMPLISAVNVEGDQDLRKDTSDRSDHWVRDRRIDLESQLNDKYYLRSNFARGHMSRFEDANWGLTVEDALRNGVYTCFHTNACPQVAALNGPGGLWGKLEKAVLEQGIKKEKDAPEARMTVFNGPIFSEKTDRLYKGIPVPMEFYKIILWRNDKGKLKATAFRLSQENLVDDINFDEALNINENVAFKNFQCSIKSLGQLTNIDFKRLEKFDTFVATAGGEENLIEDTAAIVL